MLARVCRLRLGVAEELVRRHQGGDAARDGVGLLGSGAQGMRHDGLYDGEGVAHAVLQLVQHQRASALLLPQGGEHPAVHLGGQDDDR